MSLVVSVMGIKDGQGASTLALSLAWAAAETRRVLLIDADLSGTGVLADLIALDCGSRGLGNLFGPGVLESAAVEEQAVAVPRRPRLRVVAGLRGFSGPGAGELLPRLGPALDAAAAELVVVDLGSPLAHPGQESPRRTAEAICAVSGRLLVVVQDSPARLLRSIQVLRAARPPQAELIVFETRSGVLREPLARTLLRRLPEVRVTAFLPWDSGRAARSEDAAEPMCFPGLVGGLKLEPAPAAAPPRWGRRRPGGAAGASWSG